MKRTIASLLVLAATAYSVSASAVDITSGTTDPYSYDYTATGFGDVTDVGIYWADDDLSGILTNSSVGGTDNGAAIGWYIEVANIDGTSTTYYTTDTTAPDANTLWYSSVDQTAGVISYGGEGVTASALGSGSVVAFVPSGSPEAGELATLALGLSLLSLRLRNRRREKVGLKSGASNTDPALSV